MNKIARDFISQEQRTFSFKLGRYLASALAGFLTGVVVASIVWLIGVWYIEQVQDSMLQRLVTNQNPPAPIAAPKTMPPKTPTP